jgi:hypothetical protein
VFGVLLFGRRLSPPYFTCLVPGTSTTAEHRHCCLTPRHQCVLANHISGSMKSDPQGQHMRPSTGNAMLISVSKLQKHPAAALTYIFGLAKPPLRATVAAAVHSSKKSKRNSTFCAHETRHARIRPHDAGRRLHDLVSGEPKARETAAGHLKTS